MSNPDTDMDIDFYFDPVCPFAWMTSQWIRLVQAQRDYTVDWRFISLRMINADVDYENHFPPGYEAGHTAGLKLLRVAARVRTEYGRDQVGPLYEAIGTRVFDTEPDQGQDRGSRAFIEPILRHRPRPSWCPRGLARRQPTSQEVEGAEHRISGNGRDSQIDQRFREWTYP